METKFKIPLKDYQFTANSFISIFPTVTSIHITSGKHANTFKANQS
jgi:hypothetical protein